jgi:hypothetical protein
VGDWYTIGVTAGLGAAVGVALAGVLLRPKRATLIVPVLALAAGVAIGFAAFGAVEAIGGAVGGLLGGWGAATIVRGASSRGGTRGGLLAILLVVACVAAGLAFVPVIGYVEAVALAVLGARVRSRTGSRYAGLRILARD